MQLLFSVSFAPLIVVTVAILTGPFTAQRNLDSPIHSLSNVLNLSKFPKFPTTPSIVRITALCPSMYYFCNELPAFCLTCNFNSSCIYGRPTRVACRPSVGVFCKLPTYSLTAEAVEDNLSNSAKSIRKPSCTNFTLNTEFICRYCHQLDDKEITCLGRTHCRQPYVPRSFYETFCEASPYILCMGKRVFRRMLPCQWASGKSYLVTVILSLLFGGFGVDRFYLGMWMEGLGKLLSFGGLGIWSVVDFVLILTGYVNPPHEAVYD